MSPQALRSYRQLEGHHVSVSLADGSRLDDCELVSAGRGHASTLWLHDGHDDRSDFGSSRPAARQPAMAGAGKRGGDLDDEIPF